MLDPAAVSRLIIANGSALLPRVDRSTYLRTTGAILQDYRTSPWITDEYVILPFWPEDASMTESPWNYRSPEPATWEAETTIFRSDLKCTDLSLKATSLVAQNWTSGSDHSNGRLLVHTRLESSLGCQVNLTVNTTSGETTSFDACLHWALWADIDRLPRVYTHYWTPAESIMVEHNDRCPYDNMIIMSTPWWNSFRGGHPRPEIDVLASQLANITMKAYACESIHTMARIQARVQHTTTGLSVQFDKEAFQRASSSVSGETIDLAELRRIYTDLAWSEYLAQHYGDYRTVISGAAALLGIKHKFKITEMMADNTLDESAAKLRRHFFNEIMKTALQYPGASNQQTILGTRTVTSRRVLVSEQVAWALFILLVVSSCLLLAALRFTRPDIRPIMMYRDPSTTLSLHWWAACDDRVLSSLGALDLSTRKDLKSHLGNRTFGTRAGRLQDLDEAERKSSIVHATRHLQGTSQAKILPGLRLRSLGTLLTYVSLILMATSVLFGISQRSSLRQSFFTYRAHVNVLGIDGLISPVTIVPVAFAIIIALWWESIDNTLKALQPFISMLQKQVLSLPRTQEPRRVPYVEEFNKTFYEYDWSTMNWLRIDENDVIGKLLLRAFNDLEADWMYTAILQTALGGPVPAWTKDDWSFVPIRKQSFVSVPSSNLNFPHMDQAVNMTLRTPAIRARLECSAIEQIKNVSMWFDRQPLSSGGNNSTSGNLYWPKAWIMAGNLTTRITAQGAFPECCANSTSDTGRTTESAISVIGHWTENFPDIDQKFLRAGKWLASSNFTIKWFRGPAGFGKMTKRLETTQRPQLRFTRPPDAQALNCMPVIETSAAEVTIDIPSGAVYDYKLLQTPKLEDVAWSDPFLYRNISEPPEWPKSTNITWLKSNSRLFQVTTSYGVLFLKALLRAASYDGLQETFLAGGEGRDDYDNIRDKTFNMRDNSTGMNADFMTYATYAEVGFDPNAMLDPDMLIKASQKVFSIFFQHFVNNNVSHDFGGWAYQPLNAHLSIGPPMKGVPIPLTPYDTIPPRFEDAPVHDMGRNVTATVSTSFEVLRINIVAFWISTSILIWIIIALIMFTAVQRRYLGGMQRNIECIADVLVLIAGSDKLLAVIKEKGIDTILKEDKLLTRLGWFRDPDGTMRWRIELVEEKEKTTQPIRLGPHYSHVPNNSADEDHYEGDDSDELPTNRSSFQEQTHAQTQSDETAYTPCLDVDLGDAESLALSVEVQTHHSSTSSFDISPITPSS
ncbi:hypothetical protein BKA63DRAFT_411342 [Paraphoma chrysanthemicola]|nr:hypothetical protein BKA63DRAFT_411342 [Paraphoma chrysanthemicola]